MLENLAPLFVDFAVPAYWSPSSGGPQQSARVILDAPERVAGMSIGGDYVMHVRAGEFVNIDNGETVSIEGNTYVVRESIASGDGAVRAVSLVKR